MSGQVPFFVADRSIAASQIARIAGLAFSTQDFVISAGAALETACAGELSYMLGMPSAISITARHLAKRAPWS